MRVNQALSTTNQRKRNHPGSFWIKGFWPMSAENIVSQKVFSKEFFVIVNKEWAMSKINNKINNIHGYITSTRTCLQGPVLSKLWKDILVFLIFIYNLQLANDSGKIREILTWMCKSIFWSYKNFSLVLLLDKHKLPFSIRGINFCFMETRYFHKKWSIIQNEL